MRKGDIMDVEYEKVIKTPKQKTRKARAFNFWIEKLWLIAASAFTYENLPVNLPSWEIEKRLIFGGFCGVFYNEAYGVITSTGSRSGVNIYNYANEYTYAQAVLGSKSGLVDMINCVLIYGTSLDTIAPGVIGRRLKYYADLLSDIDVSRQVALINNRAVRSVIAKTDNAFNELTAFNRQLENGEITIPKIPNGVLASTEDISKLTNNTGYSLSEYDTAQQNLLKQFYADFGKAYSTEKRERLITDEVAADSDSLDINIADMLLSRQNGVAKVNALFGTNIKVRCNNNDIVGISRDERFDS